MKSLIIDEEIKQIVSEFQDLLPLLEGKTIFMTGGSGLILSYITDIVAEFNKKTKSPCKMIIMNRSEINENSRLSHLSKDPNVKLISGDVGKKFEVIGNPDIIIHGASRANYTSFLSDPLDTIDANINGIRTLLEYAKDNPVEEFLFLSSAEIYGNPVKEFLPCPEEYTGNIDCNSPGACYTESKRLAETLCSTFFRKYNVPIKILRILLVYGPGMRNDGKVVSDFFDMAKKDKKIRIRDKGEALRSFLYISDAARAILNVLFKGKGGEVYNLGNDSENFSVLQLAKLIAEIVGGNVKVEPNLDAQEKKIYGENNRIVNISKIRALGFSPEVSLKEGLYRLKRHYEETERGHLSELAE